MPTPLQYLLSHLFSVTVDRAEGRHGTLELALEQGRPVVNSPSANQSHGSLHRIWREALNTALDRSDPPKDAVILGLGAGSAMDLLRDELGVTGPVTGVDHDPQIVAWGRTYFALDRHTHLTIVEADARTWLATDPEPVDLVLVDLFEDDRMPEWLAGPDFLDAARRLTRPGGTLLLNTMVHHGPGDRLMTRIGKGLAERFRTVQRLPLEGTNVVFIVR